MEARILGGRGEGEMGVVGGRSCVDVGDLCKVLSVLPRFAVEKQTETLSLPKQSTLSTLWFILAMSYDAGGHSRLSGLEVEQGGGGRQGVASSSMSAAAPLLRRTSSEYITPHSRLPAYLVGEGASQSPAAYGGSKEMIEPTTSVRDDYQTISREEPTDGDGDVVDGVEGGVGAGEVEITEGKKSGGGRRKRKEGWCVPKGDDLQRWPWVGWVVVCLCIFGFIWSIYLNGWAFEPLEYNPLVGPSVGALVAAGAKDTPKIMYDGEWWRLVTQLFLHGGLVHMAMNMFTLVRHGFPLERHAGTQRFAPIYIGAGILASLFSAVFLPDIISVGASGSVFGILGSIWGDFLANYSQLLQVDGGWKFCLCTLMALSITTLINLVLGLLPFVDNFAHVGGFIGGVLIGLAVMVRPRKSGISTATRATQCCALSTYFLLVLMGCISLLARWDVAGWCPLCRAVSCLPTPYWDCGYEDNLPDGTPTFNDDESSQRRLFQAHHTLHYPTYIPESEWGQLE